MKKLIAFFSSAFVGVFTNNESIKVWQNYFVGENTNNGENLQPIDKLN